MTLNDYIDYATKELQLQSIETARLDTLVLMEFISNLDRAKILANPDTPMTEAQIKVLNQLLKKRGKHLPISYITHNTEFYGRLFYINRYVLEPRPETETMIDELKSLINRGDSALVGREPYIADVGTGSGALGITASLELRTISLDLIDIDEKALEVAKKNVVLHTIKANVVKADLLPKDAPKYDILLCNLPYVPDDFHINLATTHEPKLAIFGGIDGLDIYRKLFNLLYFSQQKPLYILSESLPPSHQALASIAKGAGYDLQKIADFIQIYKLRSFSRRMVR